MEAQSSKWFAYPLLLSPCSNSFSLLEGAFSPARISSKLENNQNGFFFFSSFSPLPLPAWCNLEEVRFL